jgi:RNA polymerase sigma-70 factor (ECF subfamily)
MTSPISLEEERVVIERIKKGEREAFSILYSWYGERLFRREILPRQPNKELAEDCLRDTFRTALEKIEQFRFQNQSIYTWLRRIGINKAMDSHRRYKRDRALADKLKGETPQTPYPAPDHQRDLLDLKRMVGLSMDKMNPRYAKAQQLRLILEHSRQECADIFDITLNSFDVLLHRAAKAFREVYPP